MSTGMIRYRFHVGRPRHCVGDMRKLGAGRHFEPQAHETCLAPALQAVAVGRAAYAPQQDKVIAAKADFKPEIDKEPDGEIEVWALENQKRQTLNPYRRRQAAGRLVRGHGSHRFNIFDDPSPPDLRTIQRKDMA